MNKTALRPPKANAAPAAPAASDDTVFMLMHAAGAVEKRLEDALAGVGLSLAKFGALTFLVRAGEPLSLSECAAKMTCVRSNITQLVDRLEADGLVRRVDNPADRRGVMAAATALGIARQAAGAKLVDEVKAQFAKTLAGIDKVELSRALAAIK
jgi:DNA-binding MarR family transcriptional regulator